MTVTANSTTTYSLYLFRYLFGLVWRTILDAVIRGISRPGGI